MRLMGRLLDDRVVDLLLLPLLLGRGRRRGEVMMLRGSRLLSGLEDIASAIAAAASVLRDLEDLLPTTDDDDVLDEDHLLLLLLLLRAVVLLSAVACSRYMCNRRVEWLLLLPSLLLLNMLVVFDN
jgi:hypothetical protein